MNKTIVRHWRYEDGWRTDFAFLFNGNPVDAKREYDDLLQGWHCHVYPENDREFEKWMMRNMKGKYDCTHRFNSGDPMYTVIIKDNEDATLFKLTWM